MVYGERQIIKEPTEIERQTERQTDKLKIHKRGRNKHIKNERSSYINSAFNKLDEKSNVPFVNF